MFKLKHKSITIFSSVHVRWEHGDLAASVAGDDATDHHKYLLWKSQSNADQEVKTEYHVHSTGYHREMIRTLTSL